MQQPPTIAIRALDPEGRGLGTDERGREWRVRGAAPGSVVRAVGSRKAAILVEEVELPQDAVAPRCAAFGVCGGCSLQRLPLHAQRGEKARMLAKLLAPLGGEDHGVTGAPEGYGYRNRIDLSFGTRGWYPEGPRTGRFLGMHRGGRFDRVVDIGRCEIARPELNAVLARIRDDFPPFAIYDPIDHTGVLRQVVLRAGDDGVLVLLRTAPGADAAWLRDHAPGWGAASVLWYEDDSLREILHGDAGFAVDGFALSPTAFFQVNRADRLRALVSDALGAGDTLLDLYCGAGVFGRSARFRKVVGVDVSDDPGAFEYHRGLVEDVLPTLDLPARFSVVVDPPRVGLHPRARAAVSRLAADVLVYVACRPTSLLRDGNALLAAGWRCTDRWGLDLFPQTGHVEVVSRWLRRPP